MDTYTQSNGHANATVRKILVVDDEPVIRDMMVDILDMEGYPAEVARNGREALDKVLSTPDHYLIFLDMMMPEMDGRAFCEHLSTYPEIRKRHVIVLMSALDRLSSISSLHVDATLPKPFVVDDALEIIQRLLQSQPI
ncbi:MAG: response regulator [Ktedonobacteraceae bacterium]|nr:response regulator [Ktedonobacteraceae bacterium]